MLTAIIIFLFNCLVYTYYRHELSKKKIKKIIIRISILHIQYGKTIGPNRKLANNIDIQLSCNTEVMS